MKRPESKRRSISLRLALAMLLVSLAVSILMAALQLNLLYRQQRSNARLQLDEIGQVVVPSLVAGLWQTDPDRVNLLLDGMAQLPGVSYVLLDSEGTRMQRGHPLASPLISRRYRLYYGAGNHLPLGELTVVVGREYLVGQLHRSFIRITSTTLAGLATACIIVLLLFRKWVARHLKHLAAFADGLDLDQLDTPLVLDRALSRKPDEIDRLASAFNRLRERLREGIGKRDQQELELRAYREQLESLVRLRTAKLEEQAALLDSQRLEMQKLALTDSLTGLSNRREFMTRLTASLADQRLMRRPLAVLMLDIDHFKAINDSYGHATGDQALMALAETCQRQLRGDDIIGRLGGEEFGLLLVGANSDAALEIAERLRQSIEALRLPLAQDQTLSFTASLGMAHLGDVAENADALLARADKALYRAKHEGRNRVVVAPAAG